VKHQVFVSHSHIDAVLAEELTTALEKLGINCWIAPRDVPAGGSYADAILTALEQSSCFVLIYTERSNTSRHVLREVERAVYIGVDIIPVRLDTSEVSKSLSYFLTSVHWLSALSRSPGDFKIAADKIASSIKGGSEATESAETTVRSSMPSSAPAPPLKIPPKNVPGVSRKIFIGSVVGLLGLVFWLLFLVTRRQMPSRSVGAAPEPSLSPAQAIQTQTFHPPSPTPPPPSPEESPGETRPTTPAPTPAATQLPGERYPESRTRLLSQTELLNWSAEKIQYAINEIFARHGASFSDKKEIRTWFSQFAWYKPQTNLTFDQIESLLPEVERQNIQTLAEARALRRSAPKTVSESGLAGVWRGTITMTVPQGASFQMPCELTFDETRKEVSSLVNVDKHRGGSTHNYNQKGRTIYFDWTVPNEPGTVTNLAFTPSGDGNTASLTSVQYVRGRRISSGAGTFSKLK
jgi:hypothetical protein